MKVLCVREPRASMIAAGSVTIEIRSWRTDYRGPLLLCVGPTLRRVPTGAALAVVSIVDVRRFVFGQDEAAAGCNGFPGAWAWVLGKVSPVPALKIKPLLA